jgi:hypothetical protein
VKANVCDLEPKLKTVGFNILNGGVRIPFPGTGNKANSELSSARYLD